MTLIWTDVNGVSTPLTDAYGYRVLPGVQGFDTPPVTNTVEDYTNNDGAVLTLRRRGVRQVVLPLWVRHPTRTLSRVHELAAMLQGPGQIAYYDGATTKFLKNVIYETGLGGDLSRDSASPDVGAQVGWRKFVVSLVALDPWWYGSTVSQALPIGIQTAFSAVGVPFNAALPFDGGGSVAVNVAGDAEAFPTVTVYGPATVVSVSTGGFGWQTARSLSAADVLVVDSQQGSRGPRLNGGPVSWSLLTESSRLWTLPAGTNQVGVGVTGSTAATTVAVSFAPRYLTP